MSVRTTCDEITYMMHAKHSFIAIVAVYVCQLVEQAALNDIQFSRGAGSDFDLIGGPLSQWVDRNSSRKKK